MLSTTSLRTLVLSTLLVLLAPTLSAQDVTVESVLSAPFPSEMTAAPTGGKVAWVQNDQGVRNIWVAAPPEYEGRPITNYTEDDGQPLGSLAFSPDGETLVYVRGGSANRQGEHPNPTSDPRGAEQALWMIDVGGGEPVRLARGSSPVICPRGEGVAFTRTGGVWWIELEEGARERRFFRARGNLGSLRWSPDGAQLAFVSNRGSHSFVGIYDRDNPSVEYIAPSVDRDSNPVWSPDGTHVAYIRRPPNTDPMLFTPTREEEPWSIRIADVATGEAEELWRAEEGVGSAFWGIQSSNQLLWAADNHIVFPWEGNGWLQLYSIPADGGEVVHLTPGEFEVEDVRLSPDRRHVIYSSNQDDIDRRHLWRVDVTGGAPEAITEGRSIEWSPTPTSGGEGIAFFRSEARTPAHAAFTNAVSDDVRLMAAESIPGDFPLNHLVEPEPITYTATDGMRIPAQLFLPPDLREGERRPAVIFIHGGSRRQMLLGWHYRIYYYHAYALNQYLANRGYVVLSINFRSGTGYGMEFREAENYGAAGGSEFNDVLGAGLYLQSRPDVDPDRIGLWGGSYGGHLTAMGLARASDLFVAGVDLHGVHDWNVGIQTFRSSYNPLEFPEKAETAFQASPMAHVDTWRSPVLLIHGDDDRNVRFIETIHLVEALRARDVHVEQLIFPDEVHSFLVHDHWIQAYEATADFLERKLGSAQ